MHGCTSIKNTGGEISISAAHPMVVREMVSVTGVAWGPANSPAMISKGHKERSSREKPAFFPDRPYALAIKLQAYAPNTNSNTMWGGSGLVLIKDVSGDFQVPLVLMPEGFVHNIGSSGTMDLLFEHTNKTEVWDFFPVKPNKKEFLFQSFAFSPMQSSRGRPRASFRVLVRHDALAIMNALPGSQNACSDFTRTFSGTIGPGIKVNLRLVVQGATLTGTEQYSGIGKILWLTGKVDSFGNFVLREHYPKDHLTGIFNGTFSSGCQSMSGYLSKPDGFRLLPIQFQEVQPSK